MPNPPLQKFRNYNSMRFSSTNSPESFVDLKEAVIRSLPADNGLYMPESITPLPESFWKTWRNMPLPELGFHIAKQILGDSIPDNDLKEIVDNSITFDAPVVTIEENTHILELFHYIWRHRWCSGFSIS